MVAEREGAGRLFICKQCSGIKIQENVLDFHAFEDKDYDFIHPIPIFLRTSYALGILLAGVLNSK